jgi:adenosylmethionine---8-amino-7-oxononanoate aminotransferase
MNHFVFIIDGKLVSMNFSPEASYTHIWHPYTQMATADVPIFIQKAKDEFLYDDKGKTYIDAVSSWWVNIHGHRNKEINKAINKQIKQLEHVIFAGFTHKPALELAQKLKKVLPNQSDKIFYSDNGSTAVEVALKAALQYHRNIEKPRKKVLALHNAYHGDTFGTMSVSHRSIFNQAFEDQLFETLYIDVPNSDNLQDLIIQIEIWGVDNIAAFIYEPLIQGAGGMNIYQAEPLNALLQFLSKNEVVLIADEVMTGFYRTGKLFTSSYIDTKPDVICLSKGLTAGYLPLGVTAFNKKIYESFHSKSPEHTFYHGHSFTANPISCAIASASLDICLRPSTKEKVEAIHQSHTAFANVLSQYKHIENIRVLGTVLAFNISQDGEYNYLSDIRTKAYRYFMDKGIVLRPLGNVIYIMPPYCTSKDLFGYRTILTIYLQDSAKKSVIL